MTSISAVVSVKMLAKQHLRAHIWRMEETIALTIVVVITVFLAGYGISVWKSPGRRTMKRLREPIEDVG